MGHFYPDNLAKLFIKRIYAKGYTTIREMIKVAKQRKETMHCAEREYTDDDMMYYAFEWIVTYYHHCDCCERFDCIITADPSKAQEEALDLFKKEFCAAGSESEDAEDYYNKFGDIRWRFAPGARAKYLQKKIPFPTHFES